MMSYQARPHRNDKAGSSGRSRGHVNMSLLHLAQKNESKYIKMIAAVKRTCTVVSKGEVVDVQGNMS